MDSTAGNTDATTSTTSTTLPETGSISNAGTEITQHEQPQTQQQEEVPDALRDFVSAMMRRQMEPTPGAPLCIACARGDREAVDAYLDGTNIVSSAVLDETTTAAITTATISTQPQKGDINARGQDGMTGLMEASEAGHADLVKYLISRCADVNITSGMGLSALMWACLCDQDRSEVIHELLQAGANVHARTVSDGMRPLIMAASHGHTEICRLLVTEGKADVNGTNRVGDTALSYAAALGHMDTFRYLLFEAKANPFVESTDGSNALLESAARGHTEIVKDLMGALEEMESAGTSGSSSDSGSGAGKETSHTEPVPTTTRKDRLTMPDGKTALMRAVGAGHKDTVAYLLSTSRGKVSIDATTTTNGVTALLVAASQGRLEIVKLLLEAGANAAYASELAKGLTALDAATTNEHVEVAELIKKYLT